MVRNEDAWFSKQVATFGCPSPRAFSQIASARWHQAIRLVNHRSGVCRREPVGSFA
ncbi:MAG: hypothetical protein QOH31_7067 [Verrucomicrobiota bacterium]